jgi:hypothetical protein
MENQFRLKNERLEGVKRDIDGIKQRNLKFEESNLN